MPFSALPFPSPHYMGDLMPGMEMAQAYFLHQNAESADDCCPCECNCDIFTELFNLRVGATSSSDIEFDRQNTRVWTKTGSVNLFTGPNRASFNGNASLRCETPPIRSDDFCIGIVAGFGSDDIGQQCVIKFGDIEAVITLDRLQFSNNPYQGNYVFKGTLPGAMHTVECRSHSNQFMAALFLKDGMLSLLINGPSTDFGATFPPGASLNHGQGWLIGQTGTGAGTPPYDPPPYFAVPTSGIISQDEFLPSENFVEIESRNIVGTMELLTFRLHNHQTPIKSRCQLRYYGTDYGVNDIYPARTYQIDVHKLLGTDRPDFSIETEVGIAINRYTTYVNIPNWTNAMVYTAQYNYPSPYEWHPINIELNFTGGLWYPGNIFEYTAGRGAAVFITVGFGIGHYYSHRTNSPYESFIGRWMQGPSRSMNVVRFYPYNNTAGAYDDTQDSWVDVTALP